MDRAEQFEAIRNGHPELKFCERFNDTSNIWNFSAHSHPYLELMFFTEGTARVAAAGSRLSVSLFDTVLYPANCLHQEDPSPNLKREIICLWVDLPALVIEKPLRIQDHGNRLSTFFQAIHREEKCDRQAPYLIEYLLKALLTQALFLAYSDNQWEALPCAMQYLHANFTRPVTLGELAELEHISKSYLSRQFKRYTGMTVIEYVNNLRVELAKHLLLSSPDSITNIGYEVGYESPKYFYRTFRALAGESPARFRKAYQQHEEAIKTP
ncbi:MAG: AraC family transcriptional regulator [Oscillospiraceae bacterium]|nr:AraC family transcriptional regulator [Oscillospiraceae bacterium]